MNIERLTTPWWALRVGLGAAAFLAGLDKFFGLLADWPDEPITKRLVQMSVPAGVTKQTIDFPPVSRSSKELRERVLGKWGNKLS